MLTADHACGLRETVDESGEQPEGQPNRLAMMIGSRRPRAQPKRQRVRNGEGRNGSKGQTERKKATQCTLSSTSQAQQPQQQQQQRQQCACSDAHECTTSATVMWIRLRR